MTNCARVEKQKIIITEQSPSIAMDQNVGPGGCFAKKCALYPVAESRSERHRCTILPQSTSPERT